MEPIGPNCVSELQPVIHIEPTTGSCGTEGSLKTASAPRASSQSARSVKVPPTSTPIARTAPPFESVECTLRPNHEGLCLRSPAVAPPLAAVLLSRPEHLEPSSDPARQADSLGFRGSGLAVWRVTGENPPPLGLERHHPFGALPGARPVAVTARFHHHLQGVPTHEFGRRSVLLRPLLPLRRAGHSFRFAQ